MNYKVKANSSIGGIHSLIFETDDFDVSVTYDSYQDDTGVVIRSKSFFGPAIHKVNDDYMLCYDSITIPTDYREEFEEEYKKAVAFCKELDETLKGFVEKIKNGGTINDTCAD